MHWKTRTSLRTEMEDFGCFKAGLASYQARARTDRGADHVMLTNLQVTGRREVGRAAACHLPRGSSCSRAPA